MSDENSQQEPGASAERWSYAGKNVPKLIENCERLLEYASSNGITAAHDIAADIASAREAFARGRWSADHENRLYAAKARLSEAIRPVTLHTLCDSTIAEAKKLTRFYFRLTLALVVFIVPASMVVFTDSALSAKGKELIAENDRISLDLHNELQNYHLSIEAQGRATSTVDASARKTAPSTDTCPAAPDLVAVSVSKCNAAAGTTPPNDSTLKLSVMPPALELKRQMQDFARNNRQLYAETKWLIDLTLHASENVYDSPWMSSGPALRRNLELELPILMKSGSARNDDSGDQIATAATTALSAKEAIEDGQDIRAMAQNAQRTSDIFWGAVSTYLLPVVYAVLGALAFILREMTEQNARRTFYPAYARLANRMRLLTAVIVGTVIGLFDHAFKLPGAMASASPLAIAFISGYASDAFFAFLNRAG
ncbi:hypothetical protein BVER_03094 [Candidatus Burkholderia verschuerenii]|uniref:Transmembrane protein n=1 Tax=Candidatus Burkholderia verschuerenii TaxID=242163 RepID=A0A0L0MFZ5_9BURK|nr:hypothetical protein [Candidatus Burkholderia verschuerenii]KND61205.1 hypothetical protein BVER_03094 [Candidatus Burkholderia verschuerenii]